MHAFLVWEETRVPKEENTNSTRKLLAQFRDKTRDLHAEVRGKTAMLTTVPSCHKEFSSLDTPWNSADAVKSALLPLMMYYNVRGNISQSMQELTVPSLLMLVSEYVMPGFQVTRLSISSFFIHPCILGN